MRHYTKNNVETHSEHYRTSHPAVNVKVRSFVSSSKIAEHFNCSEDQAEAVKQGFGPIIRQA